MRLVLDASVAIAASRPYEPFFHAARTRVNRAIQGDDELVLPSFFRVEVTGALARLGEVEANTHALLEILTKAPHRVVTIGPKRSRRASDIAFRCKLRGPDALYVWLAAEERIALCTLDNEIITRAASVCKVIAP